MVKWLITGGCGFIGTNLIRYLKDKGDIRIVALDNLSVGSREDLSRVCRFSAQKLTQSGGTEGVRLVIGDILDFELLNKAAEGVDVVVHLAANTGVGPSVEDPRGDMVANVVGTFNVLEAARLNGVKRFVFASSGAPVGECAPPIHEALAPHPVSPYGASKLSGEGYCSAYFRSFGLETVVLRFGNVYGPGSSNKSSVVAKFIRQALAGEVCEVFGDGKQTRDFIFIDDLIVAVVKAVAGEGNGGEIFQIATNREHTVNELAKMLKEVLGARGAELVLQHGPARVGDVKRNYSDTTKARKRLGWTCRIDLKEGLEQTVDWFLDQS